MQLDQWLSFIAVYAVISIIPGPSVFMVTGQAIAHGPRAAFMCIFGDLLAGVVLVIASIVGVGAVLLASASLFVAVKWAGVFYLAYLGIRQIAMARTPAKRTIAASTSIKAGFITGILNPKAIIFYMAFLPQFIDPNASMVLQFTVLVATSTFVVGFVLSGYALAATKTRRAFQSKAARRRFDYAGGGFLIGGSVLVATTR